MFRMVHFTQFGDENCVQWPLSRLLERSKSYRKKKQAYTDRHPHFTTISVILTNRTHLWWVCISFPRSSTNVAPEMFTDRYSSRCTHPWSLRIVRAVAEHKTRLQHNLLVFSLSAWPFVYFCWCLLWWNPMYAGLWRGLGVRILMIGTLTALQWFIYDLVKVQFRLPRPPPPEMPESLKLKLEAAGKDMWLVHQTYSAHANVNPEEKE